jgi:hypothetical protein
MIKNFITLHDYRRICVKHSRSTLSHQEKKYRWPKPEDETPQIQTSLFIHDS